MATDETLVRVAASFSRQKGSPNPQSLASPFYLQKLPKAQRLTQLRPGALTPLDEVARMNFFPQPDSATG